MEKMLSAIMRASPVGLAIFGCVALAFALAAWGALGKERRLREATERAHEGVVRNVIETSRGQIAELARYRRFFDCAADAIIEGVREGNGPAIPSPGRILESCCASTPEWRRELAECTGLIPVDVERLLKSQLPMTPGLARRLEVFPGAPARYWELLWRLYEEHRMETEPTGIIPFVGRGALLPEQPACAPRPASLAPSAPLLVAEQTAEISPPPTVRTAFSEPHATRLVRRTGGTSHLPLPASPTPILRVEGSGVPTAPIERLGGPLTSFPNSGSNSPAKRAATLTDFPIQREDGAAALPNDWTEIGRGFCSSRGACTLWIVASVVCAPWRSSIGITGRRWQCSASGRSAVDKRRLSQKGRDMQWGVFIVGLVGWCTVIRWAVSAIVEKRTCAAARACGSGTRGVYLVHDPKMLRAQDVAVSELGDGLCVVYFDNPGTLLDIGTPQAREILKAPSGAELVAVPTSDDADDPWQLDLHVPPSSSRRWGSSGSGRMLGAGASWIRAAVRDDRSRGRDGWASRIPASTAVCTPRRWTTTTRLRIPLD